MSYSTTCSSLATDTLNNGMGWWALWKNTTAKRGTPKMGCLTFAARGRGDATGVAPMNSFRATVMKAVAQRSFAWSTCGRKHVFRSFLRDGFEGKARWRLEVSWLKSYLIVDRTARKGCASKKRGTGDLPSSPRLTLPRARQGVASNGLARPS